MFVILPGLLCDSRMFRAQLDGFANSMCIDGFYPSCTSLEDMAAYALEHMPDRCTVLGHSMGARVALEVLRLAPERVERLILADTGVHPLRAGERESRYALRDLGRAEGIEKLVDAWLPRCWAKRAN
jgi:pimeloyl-ACP methyl ester carboxylesterase